MADYIRTLLILLLITITCVFHQSPANFSRVSAGNIGSQKGLLKEKKVWAHWRKTFYMSNAFTCQSENIYKPTKTTVNQSLKMFQWKPPILDWLILLLAVIVTLAYFSGVNLP